MIKRGTLGIFTTKKDIENNKSYDMIFRNIDWEEEQNFEKSVCSHIYNKREGG